MKRRLALVDLSCNIVTLLLRVVCNRRRRHTWWRSVLKHDTFYQFIMKFVQTSSYLNETLHCDWSKAREEGFVSCSTCVCICKLFRSISLKVLIQCRIIAKHLKNNNTKAMAKMIWNISLYKILHSALFQRYKVQFCPVQ